jgi:group I intron endonuclease
MEKTYSVYKHTTPDGKVYIGATCDIKRRWRDAGVGYRKQKFGAAIQEFGWDNIEHEVLHKGLTKAEAEKFEEEEILNYKSHDPQFGYNMTFGGKYNKKTEETKQKISRIVQEQFDNGREAHSYWKGKKRSAEYRAHLSKVLTGRKLSPEACRHIAEAKMGEKNPMYGKRPSEKNIAAARERSSKPVRQLKGEEEVATYESIKSAYEATGIHHTNIGRVCNGERKTAGGYRWEYCDKANGVDK